MPPREGLDLGNAVETLRDFAHLAQRLDKYREVIQSRCQLVQLDIRAPIWKVGEGEPQRYRFADYGAYYRQVKNGLAASLAAGDDRAKLGLTTTRN
ncbi:hypothetical protein RFM26_08235 [Mesorhizobium sp. VK23B]|uniref:Uncharacterized protein n=1 Tax=Mesorhizobium dulcispinae TaxID=3072316 RepID=A0ABU4XCM2_9HYPH|nr:MULTISPECIES: hypothetical protein [unclassified Mesorhizobium]MDX8465668.1 hypothetical protein [Mesorhizobium sp. VK23B]MDX8471530.1 hypothetical protein [Mesorhizobium sp. VK23A]